MPEGWVLQHSWVASVALELPVARLQRANISDDFLQISLAHPALEARHHRLVAGDDVFMWMQDGIADIGLIGDDRRAIGQRHDTSVNACQNRRIHHRAAYVAAAAAIGPEQLRTVKRGGLFMAIGSQPVAVILL